MTNRFTYRVSYLNKFKYLEDITQPTVHRISSLEDDEKLRASRRSQDFCIRGCGAYLSSYNWSQICAPCDEVETDMTRKADLLVRRDGRGQPLPRIMPAS